MFALVWFAVSPIPFLSQHKPLAKPSAVQPISLQLCFDAQFLLGLAFDLIGAASAGDAAWHVV